MNKKIKFKVSLDQLVLKKETVMDLSEGKMGAIVGGVTENTHNGCHSLWAEYCASYDTMCWSVCEPECLPSRPPGEDTTYVGCSISCSAHFTNCCGETAV